jgi:hypothetical protein
MSPKRLLKFNCFTRNILRGQRNHHGMIWGRNKRVTSKRSSFTYQSPKRFAAFFGNLRWRRIGNTRETVTSFHFSSLGPATEIQLKLFSLLEFEFVADLMLLTNVSFTKSVGARTPLSQVQLPFCHPFLSLLP